MEPKNVKPWAALLVGVPYLEMTLGGCRCHRRTTKSNNLAMLASLSLLETRPPCVGLIRIRETSLGRHTWIMNVRVSGLVSDRMKNTM